MLLHGDGKQVTPDNTTILVRLRKPKDDDASKKEDANKKDNPEKTPESPEAKQTLFLPGDWDALTRERRTYLANVQEKTGKSAGSSKSDSSAKKKPNPDQVPSEPDPEGGNVDDNADAKQSATTKKKA